MPTSFRRVLHVDLDAFYVSAERVSDPSLTGRPVVVGGDPGGRGVVACASYEARRYGVRSGMPTATAIRLCPQVVLLPPRFDLYRRASQAFNRILLEAAPLVEPMGLDEAYLEPLGLEGGSGLAAVVGEAIRERVRRELGLTASVGIAGSKAVAKVASERCKPDGLLEVPPGGDAAFLAPLTVEALSGIGPRTASRLRGEGLATLGALAAAPPANLRRMFGAWGDLLQLRARGEDDSPVARRGEAKSISRETTLARDTSDPEELASVLRRLSEGVGERLLRHGRLAGVVFLKLRWGDFTTIGRQSALGGLTVEPSAIYQRAWSLLEQELRAEREGAGRAVRLVGVGVAGLSPPGAQLPLWGEEGGEGHIRPVQRTR